DRVGDVTGRRAARRRRGWWCGCGCGGRRGWLAAVEAEEPDRERGHAGQGQAVADACDAVRLDLGAVAGACPAGLRGVGGRRGLADPEYVRPLLDLLAEVRVEQRGVRGAVPQLDSWPGAGVAGIGAADEVTPLLRGLDDLALRALRVPHRRVGGGEAAE